MYYVLCSLITSPYHCMTLRAHVCVSVLCMFIKTVFFNTAHTLCWEVLFHVLLCWPVCLCYMYVY
jgi:hypothetical protein